MLSRTYVICCMIPAVYAVVYQPFDSARSLAPTLRQAPYVNSSEEVFSSTGEEVLISEC